MDEYGKALIDAGRLDDALVLLNELDKSEFSPYVLSFHAIQGDKLALEKFFSFVENSNNKVNLIQRLTMVYFKLERYDESAIWFDKMLTTGVSYYRLKEMKITDPSITIKDSGLNEILSRPGLSKLMKIRRKNLEQFQKSKL